MDIYQYSTLYYDQDPYEMEKVEKEKYDVFKSIFKKVHLVKRTIEYEKDLINISTIINEYKFIHEKVINNNEDVKKYLTKANIMGYVDAASLIFNKPVFPDRRYELLNFFIQTISKIYENDTIFSKDSSAFHIIMKNVNGPYYGQNDDTIIENYIPTTSCSIREMAMNACLDEYKKHMKIKKYSIDELEAQLSQTFENTIRQRISIMDHNQIIINKRYASPNTRYNIYFQEFLLLFNVCNLIDIKNMKLKPTTNQKVIKDYGIILDLLDKYIQNPQTFNSTIYKDLTIISRINLGLIMEILFIVILIIMKNDKSSIVRKHAVKLLQSLKSIWIHEGIVIQIHDKFVTYDYRYKFGQLYAKYFQVISKNLNISNVNFSNI